MPEETEAPAKADETGKTFTQADVDRIVADRLAREKGKYADYDDLKAKAAKLEEIESANKSETDKLREENDRLKQAAATTEAKALRVEVAMAKGLSAAQAKRLVGATKEELEADADEILETLPTSDAAKPPPSEKPTADLKGGTDPTSDADETDPRKLAASVPRI